jgi:hypothetical protein
VSSRDGKGTGANQITHGAVNLEPVRRVAGNSATVLEVLGVSEEHGADNLVADFSAAVGDSGGC